jgi:hypothetical protein
MRVFKLKVSFLGERKATTWPAERPGAHQPLNPPRAGVFVPEGHPQPAFGLAPRKSNIVELLCRGPAAGDWVNTQ